MGLLVVNGLTIPVKQGTWRMIPEPVGGDLEDLQDGSVVDTRRRIRLRQIGETSHLKNSEWLAYIGLLNSRGCNLRYEVDLYGEGGEAPEAGAVATVRSMQEIVGGVSNPRVMGSMLLPVGSGCVVVESPTTNLLPQNVRTGTDSGGSTTGFTALITATISSAIEHAWQGTKALKVVTAASIGSGIETDAVAAAAGLASASVYVYAESAISVRVRLYDVTGATYGTAETRTLTANRWHRFQVQHTLTGGSPTAKIVVDTDTAAIKEFWCDGFQLEDLDYHTSWVGAAAGATASRGAGQLTYRFKQLRPPTPIRELTLAAWVRFSLTGHAAITTARLWYLRRQTANGLGDTFATVHYDRTSDELRATFTYQGVAGQTTLVKAAPFTNGAWHHVAVTWTRANSPAGNDLTSLYFDGTLVQSSTSMLVPFVDLAVNELLVGHKEATEHWDGPIDSMLVLPYAATAAMIADMASSNSAPYTEGLPNWEHYPVLQVRSEILGSSFGPYHMLARGRAKELAGAPFSSAGVWQQNAGRLSFELVETFEAENTEDAVAAVPFNLAYNEVPSGTINSTTGSDGNDTFTLANTPSPGSAVRADYSMGPYMNGVHFTVSGNTVTATAGNNPLSGSTLKFTYPY